MTRRLQPPPAVARMLPLLVAALAAAWTSARAGAADLERDPINYSTAPADNAVSRLQQRLDAGAAALAFDDKFGYLPALLREFHIPETSQTLVFSKTSRQRDRISPRTPRALYFTDDAYVGFCHEGDFLEIAAVDPRLGSVFYTLDQTRSEKPRFQRQDDECLICHASSANQEFPGQLARSVYTDGAGQPVLSLGSYRVDHTTPYAQRWGGWYVTGTTGKMTHLGNLVVGDERDPSRIDNTSGENVTDLGRRLRTADYLTGHSDVVALMVLEHQTEMHNRIARAGFLTRIALYDEAEMNKALGRPAGEHSDGTRRRIKSACEPLVKYLLFSGEARLPDKVQGSTEFARQFAARGPRDASGRSLRDLDLTTRLFAHPCSYLIYSDAFDALPDEAKDYVLRRLWEVLTGKDRSEAFAHLSDADRRAVLEILTATKKDLPDYWRAAGGA
jgi:hypothetical protein